MLIALCELIYPHHTQLAESNSTSFGGCGITEPFPDNDDLSARVLLASDGIQNILFLLQRKTDILT